jgi:hypothetical protein
VQRGADIWQMHFSLLSGQEYTAPGMFIANLLDEPQAAMPIAPLAPPPQGHQILQRRITMEPPIISRCRRRRWELHGHEYTQRLQQDIQNSSPGRLNFCSSRGRPSLRHNALRYFIPRGL